MSRTALIVGACGIVAFGMAANAALSGRIHVAGEQQTQLRLHVTTDSNVSLVSAAAIYAWNGATGTILTPATFAIKRGRKYYIRFDAEDSTNIIDVSATGGMRFGFGSMGSRYRGVSVACGSPGESAVQRLRPGTSFADRSCPG